MDIKRASIDSSMEKRFFVDNYDSHHQSIENRIFKKDGQGIFVKRRFLYDIPIRKEDEFCLSLTMRNHFFESETKLLSDSLYDWLDKEQIPQEKKEEILDIICNCYAHKSSMLDLSGFGLRSLPPIPDNVCYLLLSNNKFSAIPPILPEKIVYLDLSHNMISTVDINYLNSLQYLETLDLSSNQLTEFTEIPKNIVILNCKKNLISKKTYTLENQSPRMLYCGFEYHEIIDLSSYYSPEKDKDILFSFDLKKKAHEVNRYSNSCYVIDAPCPTALQKKQCVYKTSVIKLINAEKLLFKFVENEIRISKLVSHVNLNKYFICNGHYCLVMNNLGVDLVSFLIFLQNQKVKIDIEYARILFRNLLDKLIVMKKKHGIYHNDIKPENILIDQIGFPHLIDFASANELPTNHFIYCESSDYKPPEYNEYHPYDSEKKDAYSLGKTMHLFHRFLKECDSSQNSDEFKKNKKHFLRFKRLIENLTHQDYMKRYSFEDARLDVFFNAEEMKDMSLKELSWEYAELYKNWEKLQFSLNKIFFEKEMKKIQFWMTYKEIQNQLKKHKEYLEIINSLIQSVENQIVTINFVLNNEELKQGCLEIFAMNKKLHILLCYKAKTMLPFWEEEINEFSNIGSELNDSSSIDDFKKTHEKLSFYYLKELYDIKKQLLDFIKSEEEDISMMQESFFYNKEEMAIQESH